MRGTEQVDGAQECGLGGVVLGAPVGAGEEESWVFSEDGGGEEGEGEGEECRG